MIDRIVSGGQTGVDRAALDVALRLGVQLPGVQLRHPPLRVSGSRSRLASL